MLWADKIGDDSQFMGLLFIVAGLILVLYLGTMLLRLAKTKLGQKKGK